MLRPVIILSIILLCTDVNCSTDDLVYMMHDCSSKMNSYSHGSAFESNLNDTLFTELPAKALDLGFYNFSKGEGFDQVYALFYCRGDVNSRTCHSCVQSAAVKIASGCKLLKEGIVWYDQCTLRYANRFIFSIGEASPVYIYPNKTGIMNEFALEPYRHLFDNTMKNLVVQAASNRSLNGFATKTVPLSPSQSLHCLVQCTPDVIGDNCGRCLRAALNQRDLWANTKIFLPSCFIMYDLFGPPFSQPKPLSGPPVSVINHSIIGVAGGIIVVVAAIIGAYIFCFQKRDKIPKELAEVTARGGAICYSYEELCKATSEFYPGNVVGRGGFGKVYQGVLPNGDVVAIKKLNPEKIQGEIEFLSEIKALGRIHHRHLVSLLGFCIDGSHRLLVYEFMENNSLYFHLHGPKRRYMEHWPNRKRIALGAANGLAYLHHSCEPRIIHRDIKSSNILLDSNFDAKISDFGLARFIPHDATHVTTEAHGTFGYIAPEINLGRKGEVTEKTDVYSFGVVLLELISGRKPEYANWASDVIAEGTVNGDCDYIKFIDSRLKNYDDNEMRHILACAVDCVQTSACKRPTMSKVLEDIISQEERELMRKFSSSVRSVATDKEEYKSSRAILHHPHE